MSRPVSEPDRLSHCVKPRPGLPHINFHHTAGIVTACVSSIHSNRPPPFQDAILNTPPASCLKRRMTMPLRVKQTFDLV